jgi:NIMA (never in mitosis gene a)-related kinase 2
MVALRPPFEASNHLALATKIIQGKIERIPERYSEDLQIVIEQMLSTEPDKRPSVDQLAENPKIKLRMQEREMREAYSNLKKKEQQLNEKSELMKKREETIKEKEE